MAASASLPLLVVLFCCWQCMASVGSRYTFLFYSDGADQCLGSIGAVQRCDEVG
ncbi:hypothetical protein ASPWEDRAFT_187504, partial [Aspergillus wentii DTO 134E9]